MLKEHNIERIENIIEDLTDKIKKEKDPTDIVIYSQAILNLTKALAAFKS